MSESELDKTFPTNLFKINGYKIVRCDRNRFGEGLFLYVNERVLCRLLQGHPNFPSLEILVLEDYQSNRKWLFLGVYKSPSQNNIEFLNRTWAILDYYFQKYYNVTMAGNFNITVENTHLQGMMQAYNLNNMIKEPTCFQLNNPRQIDPISINQKSMYKFSNTFETGLSDHQKLISFI